MNAVVSVPTPSAAEALREHESRLEGHRSAIQALTQQIANCAPAIATFETKQAELNALQEQRRAALIAAADGDVEAAARVKHLKHDIAELEDELVVLEHRASLARQERARLHALLVDAQRAHQADESERLRLECDSDEELLVEKLRECEAALATVKRLEGEARHIASRHDSRARQYEATSGRRRSWHMGAVLKMQADTHERTASDLRRLGVVQ